MKAVLALILTLGILYGCATTDRADISKSTVYDVVSEPESESESESESEWSYQCIKAGRYDIV